MTSQTPTIIIDDINSGEQSIKFQLDLLNLQNLTSILQEQIIFNLILTKNRNSSVKITEFLTHPSFTQLNIAG